MSAARAAALWLGLCLAWGCSNPPAVAQPVCNRFQFRACKAPCGRGVQQCAASRLRWGRCQCVIVDASLEVSIPDGGSDSGDASFDRSPGEAPVRDARGEEIDAAIDAAPDR